MSMPSTIKTHSWIYLSAIQVGGSICLPVIMIGHILCQHYGLMAALLAILIGNLLLFFLGLATTSMGAVGRKSTAECTSLYFGESGSRLFAALMICCTIGWFAIQLNMMNLSVDMFVGSTNSLQLNSVILGGLITLFAMNGLNMIGKIANLSIPFLLITFGWILWDIPSSQKKELETLPFTWNAISLVMAVSIASVIDLPNFFKYARSKRDGIMTIALLFGVATPLIEGVGVYISYASPDLSLVEALQNSGMGKWAACFLLLGGWLTNNANLFSATVSAEKLFPNIPEKMRVLWLGCAGIVIACMDPFAYLEEVINIMGIAVGSMGAIIIVGHLLGISQSLVARPASYSLFWVCGMMMGLLAMFSEKIAISGIALMDAFIIAALLTAGKYFFIWRNT